MKLALALLLLTAPAANAVVTGRTIVQSYERIMRSHLSQIAPEKRHEVARHWLAPGADPFKAGDSSSDTQLSAALGVMSRAAATLDEGERATLPEQLRASLQKILKQLDTSVRKEEVVDEKEREAVSRSVYNVYRPVHRLYSLALSEDGKWIAYGELQDKTVSILDYQTQTLVKKLKFKRDPSTLRFSPDKRFLAISFFSHGQAGFEIFETVGWKPVLKENGGGYYEPIFLKGSDRVVEWGRKRNRIFSLTSKKANRSPPELADLYLTDQVTAPDGSWFAGVDPESKRIEIFSGEGVHLRGFALDADPGNKSVYIAAPDGKTLVRVDGKSVDFHDFASGKFLSRQELGLNEEARGMTVDRQGKQLFVSEKNGGVHVYRIESGASGPTIRRITTLVLPKERRFKPENLILTPDEKKLLIKTYEKIVMFDLGAGRLLGEF